jgi:acyl dehydratase
MFSAKDGTMFRINTRDFHTLVGAAPAYSAWLPIEQDRIDKFAEATGDFQWIHVDVERSKHELGGTIAHGFLTLSMISHFLAETLTVLDMERALNYGLNKVRFITPVPAGGRIRLRHAIASATEKGDGIQVLHDVAVELEGSERPACVAEQIVLYYGRKAGEAGAEA